MVPQLLLLGLMANVASASAISPRQVVPNYPTKATSKGFHLIANVTDPSTDFTPPINNFYVNGIHVGAGLSLVGLTADPGRIFYQNGTDEEVFYGQSNVITDGGTPPFPQGITLPPDEGSTTVSTARIDAGPGQAGVGLSSFPEPYTYLLPETFAACNESIEYYQGRYFIVIKQVAVGEAIPEECAAVRLVPECTTLNELPDDAISSHEYAADSECYEDVSGLDWSQYGP